MEKTASLTTAMAEVKAILDKHDLAGIVILHAPEHNSPGSVERLIKIDPSYSCAQFTENMENIRLALQPYNGDEKKQKFVLENTIDMVNQLAMYSGAIGGALSELGRTINRIMDAMEMERRKVEQLNAQKN